MALSGLEDLLEIVGFEVMAEGVRAGTHSYRAGLRELHVTHRYRQVLTSVCVCVAPVQVC